MATKKTTTKEEGKKVESTLILSPRITEKASVQSNANAYTFVVAQNATKVSLKAEIKRLYKVSPTAVTISNLKGKNVFVRGKFGKTATIKKAVVFLKKGDSLAIAG